MKTKRVVITLHGIAVDLYEKLISKSSFLQNSLIDYFLDPKKRHAFFNVSDEEAKKIINLIKSIDLDDSDNTVGSSGGMGHKIQKKPKDVQPQTSKNAQPTTNANVGEDEDNDFAMPTDKKFKL